MFTKLLVANRGEIAVRIIRACKEMGILTVAVFSEADREALHVSLRTRATASARPRPRTAISTWRPSSPWRWGAAPRRFTRLWAAERKRPLRRPVRELRPGLRGAKPQGDLLMGDKDEARRTMAEAGVPVTPGSGLIQDQTQLLEEAARIGFPLLVKARAGGGGRGIRLVQEEEGLLEAYAAAAQEAKAAFGDGEVYLEKYLKPVKHIEVQLLCDKKGNVRCLPERECSLQRRNQKLVEEKPVPGRGRGAARAPDGGLPQGALACGYEGAGTVEYLLDKDGNFYFMEMNTRLQVEHPVTETVTGLDLVKWQIRIAAGLSLDFSQEEVQLLGHAIECRINAENPLHNFLPSCGRISLLHIPAARWCALTPPCTRTTWFRPYYDSMIGKLIVGAKTREEAVRKMQAALCELVIEGVEHTGEMHMELLALPEFLSGSYTTDTLQAHPSCWAKRRRTDPQTGRDKRRKPACPSLKRGCLSGPTCPWRARRARRRRPCRRTGSGFAAAAARACCSARSWPKTPRFAPSAGPIFTWAPGSASPHRGPGQLSGAVRGRGRGRSAGLPRLRGEAGKGQAPERRNRGRGLRKGKDPGQAAGAVRHGSRLHDGVHGLRRGRKDRKALRVRPGAAPAGAGLYGFRRGADAGGHPLADADGQGVRRRAPLWRGGAALCLRADRSHHRRP